MGETEILTDLAKELRLDQWWKDLLGQNIESFSELDFDIAEKALPTSDVTAAQAIKKKLNGMFTFVEKHGEWYIWNGIIHTPCDGGNVVDRLISHHFYPQYTKALEMVNEAKKRRAAAYETTAPAEGTGSDEAAKFVKMIERKFMKAGKFEEKLGANSGVLAILRRMQSEFSVSADYFENDRRWFVTKDFVLDLHELKVNGNWVYLPHEASRNVTKFFDASWDGQNHGHWDSFLERSIPDPEARTFAQKVIGASFMGITKSRMIVNLFGPPSSGKSTIIDAIQKLGKGGDGYCVTLDKHAIMKTDQQTNFGQNECKGRRFISVSEPDHRNPADDDFLKAFSGDENISTRGMYVSHEEWTPQGILFIASNAPLRINTRDKAIVDRLHLIPFPNTFESNAVDPTIRRVEGLEDMLYADRSRILEWILEGMALYIGDGMTWKAPASVLQFRGEVIANASVAYRWLNDMITEGFLQIDMNNDRMDLALSVGDAYSRFRMWKSTNGERSNLTRAFFAEDIKTHYLPTERHRGTEMFRYIVKTDKYRKQFEMSSAPPQEQSSPGIKF